MKTTGNMQKFEIFSGQTAYAVEKAKEQTLKNAAKEGKKIVAGNMPTSIGKRRHQNRKPLSKNVTGGLVPDKIFGGKRARIKGGKDTGTLWHIVDGGTRRSRRRKFLDASMKALDTVTEKELDTALGKEFKRR